MIGIQFIKHTMPKVLSNLPVSGLFGVMKPSGPTSMSVVHDLQQLIARSKIFVSAEKLEEAKKRKPTKRRGKQSREAIKVGQGGTLDPLADGVLGSFISNTPENEGLMLQPDSHWHRKGNQKVI